MGIKQLNHFLMENCTSKSIYKACLKQFANKTIVIDTSIYLYKFAEKNAVAENMYLMISVFRQYNIVPVFVFDGKPPIEKKALLIKRKIEKDAAEVKYNELKSAMESGEYTTTTVTAALTEMDMLKKQFIRVSEKDIAKSKEIMRAYGVPYIESKGESDHLCAFLVKHGFAWACLSDDMDMFLYGCPRVIRHLSLLHHEGFMYDTAQILVDLDMTQDVFNDIAILSGTDYNMTNHKSLSDTLRLYMRYREWSFSHETPSGLPTACAGYSAPLGESFNSDAFTIRSAVMSSHSLRRNCSNINASRQNTTKPVTFYEWLIETTDYIDDLNNLQCVRKLFDLNVFLETHREEFKAVVDTMPFHMRDTDLELLKDVLLKDGFLFA